MRLVLDTSVVIALLASDEEREKICALAELVASLRTGVERDRMHKVSFIPELEIGSRLVKQLVRMGEMLRL